MFLILLSNLILFLVIRYFLKRNIFLNKISYFFIFSLIVIFLSTPLRISYRATSLNTNFSLEFFIAFFVAISGVLVFLPIVLEIVLSEKNKLQLQELEIKFTSFIYERQNEIRTFVIKKLSFWEKFETIFLNFCLKLSLSLLLSKKEILFLLFLIIPWLFFIIFFFVDFFIKGSCYLSIFSFGAFLFLPRIFSLLLFFAKTTLYERFVNLYLSCSPKLFYSTIEHIDVVFLDFQFIINLIFKPVDKSLKTKQDFVIFWKKLNQLLLLFIYFSICQNFWKDNLPRAKKFFHVLNFITLVGIILLKICFPFFCWYLFVACCFLPFYFLFTFSFVLNAPLETFLKELPGNIGFFQQALRVEKGFSSLEVSSLDFCRVDLPKTFLKPKNFVDFFGCFIFLAPLPFLLFFFFFAEFPFEDFLSVLTFIRKNF